MKISQDLGYEHNFLIEKTNSVAFSPQANYTDWATATYWRNLVPTLVDRGVSRGQHGGSPTAVNLSFLDWSRYFFFQLAPQLCSRGWVDCIPDPLLCRKFGIASNRTQDLWVSSQKLWQVTEIAKRTLHSMHKWDYTLLNLNWNNSTLPKSKEEKKRMLRHNKRYNKADVSDTHQSKANTWKKAAITMRQKWRYENIFN
jgi:hypothetical protein